MPAKRVLPRECHQSLAPPLLLFLLLGILHYLEFIARVTSHIPDKGQVMIRYYGLYANAQRPPPSQIVQKELLMAAEERGEYF